MQLPHVALNTSPDVLVIGAGPAGIAAMVGASRAGATVTLLEKNGYPGGKATAAYVGTVCGLWYRNEDPVPHWVHDGFPKEFADRLQEYDSSVPQMQKEGLHYLPYDHGSFIALCDALIREHTKSVCFHATVAKASSIERRLNTVDVVSGGRHLRFHPATVVDASGEAILSQSLLLDRIASDTYQAAAQVFGFTGVEGGEHGVGNLSLMRAVRQGVAAGSLPAECEKITVVPGSGHNGSVYLKLAIPMEVNDHPGQRAAIELFARDAVRLISRFLKEHHPLFRNATLAFVAPEAGIRTGPRYKGREVLTDAFVLNAVKHPNAIARGAWPIEHWEPRHYADMTYFAAGDHYDITVSMLRSTQYDNFYFAGRNLSAENKAIASARVIGTCLATGFAAGVLAAGNAMDASEYASIRKIHAGLGMTGTGAPNLEGQ